MPRSEVRGQLARVTDDLVDEVRGRAQLVAGQRRQRLAEFAQPHLDECQVLADAVVQELGDLAALLLFGGDQLRGQVAQLLPVLHELFVAASSLGNLALQPFIDLEQPGRAFGDVVLEFVARPPHEVDGGLALLGHPVQLARRRGECGVHLLQVLEGQALFARVLQHVLQLGELGAEDLEQQHLLAVVAADRGRLEDAAPLLAVGLRPRARTQPRGFGRAAVPEAGGVFEEVGEEREVQGQVRLGGAEAGEAFGECGRQGREATEDRIRGARQGDDAKGRQQVVLAGHAAGRQGGSDLTGGARHGTLRRRTRVRGGTT